MLDLAKVLRNNKEVTLELELWLIVLLGFAIAVPAVGLAVKGVTRLTLGVKNFNSNHPEKLEGEVFLSNGWEDDYMQFGWKTKRKGNQAYDIYGTPLKTGYPVFVKKSELQANGIDTTKFETRWVNPKKIP
jgi:hypothetical protein